jgi:hypothetical protein
MRPRTNGRCSSARCAWALAAGWAALIFVASSIPGSALVAGPVVGFDKIVHALVYAVLGALTTRALIVAPGLAPAPAALCGAALAALYGVSDEWHQSFVPGRFPSVGDVVADALGAAAGAGVVFLRRKGGT